MSLPLLRLLCCALWIAVTGSAAIPAARFTSPLPDPLIAIDGTSIQSRDQWATRRAEIVQLFASEVYGRAAVGRPAQLGFHVTENGASAFEGTARRRLVDIKYAGPGGEGAIALRLYLPPAGVKPKGCFVLIVNRDRAIITDAEAKPMEFWPAKAIVDRGYIAAAFHNSDVAIDEKTDSWTSGVFKVFGPSLADRKPDDWGTIAAWSWGTSRVVDYLQSDPELARLPIAVVGHSRGGKAALWCGAQDERVALTISNNSGCSGAALARRTRGETVQRINTKYPYWFCGNYKKYNNREEMMPVDQHLLIAAIAPRRAYVASASENTTADPAAEFGACLAAEPAFRLFGRSGVGVTARPAIDTPVQQGSVGYHMRAGIHDLKAWDWQQFMTYTDRHWKTP